MIIEYLPIIITVIGFVLSFISEKRSKTLIRGVEFCEDAIIEQIEKQSSSIAIHFKNEFNRILNLAFSKVEINGINNIGIEELDLKLTKNTLRFFQQAYKHIKKIEFTHLRIKIYRVVIFLILVFAIVKILWPHIISILLFNTLLTGSIIFILLFSFDVIVYTDTLIDKIRKEYGIQI